MYIFKTAYCTELSLNVRTGNSLEDYDKVDFPLDPDNCIPGTLEVNGVTPTLGTDAEDDAEAAIAIYQYLGELDELEASDRRLWTTLAHVTFREYVMARWPGKSEKADTRKNSILKRWFAEGGSDRTLEQNAIARLWWGAHLTAAPWKSNPDEFSHLVHEDEFYYTRLLFSLQELIKVTMESSLGRSNKFLITLLAYLDKHRELVNNKDIGPLMKELNLIAGASKVLVLNAKELEDLIDEAADSLFASRTSMYAK